MEDHWIACEEQFCEEFYEEHGREPTQEEIVENMTYDRWSSYISGLADFCDYNEDR